MYDEPYTTPFDPRLEVGWAVWLVAPQVAPAPGGDGEWTSRAFVGTRVSSAEHTFCGCQFMRGDRRVFRLTEHGRAQMQDLASPADGRPWYLNMTRNQINRQIDLACRPYSRQPCPADNETAIREWQEGREHWVLPPWVEMYSGLPA